MKIFPKAKANVDQYFSEMKEYLFPLVIEFRERLRLDGRVRLANRWGRKHPKRLFAYFVSSVLCIGICDFVISSCIFACDKNNEQQKVLTVQPMFQGMHEINARKMSIKNNYDMMVQKSKQLGMELDSLNAIENKTKEDSIDIKVKREQIIIISNLIRNEKD